jgi:hypothetical protein
MSDMPVTQNQQIISTLMRAYEHKEIVKLREINDNNKKLLKRFDSITRGKELRVGHHSIREEQFRPKTLNMDRNI